MAYIKKRTTYMIIVEDEKVAKYLKEVLDQWKTIWWKYYVKYYNDTEENPYYSTVETSKG